MGRLSKRDPHRRRARARGRPPPRPRGRSACLALMLACTAASPALEASTACLAPQVVHSDHWDRPPISEAELLAARILTRERRLFAADESTRRGLARDIDAVLARIRGEYQEMAAIVARETSDTPRSVILELEPELLDAIDRAVGDARAPVALRTGHSELDCLNSRLGLRAVNVNSLFGIAVLYFERPIDFSDAAARYSTMDGVGYVEPNALLGGGPDLGMLRAGPRWYVVFRDASGDCPAGCIDETLHFFLVQGEEVEKVAPERASRVRAFATIAAQRRWRAPPQAPTECPAPQVVHSDHWDRPPLSEAELLAARILTRERRLFAADESTRRGLARDIDAVLARIRGEYQEMAAIVARETSDAPRSVILELEPELLDAIDRAVGDARAPVALRTGNSELDCLNSRLGLRAVNVFSRSGLAVFYFERPIDFSDAAARYSTMDGVGYVEPNALLGDGPDLGMLRAGPHWYVVFRDASGDCPAGCIDETLHFFLVRGEEVEKVAPERALRVRAFATIAAQRRWRALPAAFVPGEPRSVRAAGAAGTVQLAWQTPADDGGLPILRYEYRARTPDGAFGAWTSTGLETSATLPAGEAESRVVEIRAVNAAGAGIAARVAAEPGSEQAEQAPTSPAPTSPAAASRAWLARFGRTMSEQVVEAVQTRLRSSPGTRVVLGGHALGRSGRRTQAARLASPRDERSRAWRGREETRDGLDERELLLRSAVRVSEDRAEDGSARWTTWGRASASRFDGRAGDAIAVDGDAVTATLGVDVERAGWLAGVALSHGRGEGTAGAPERGDALESTLTGVHPYVRYRGERVAAWAVAGRGTGRQRLASEGSDPLETDLEMTMGAVGVRSALSSPSETGGFDVAARSDLLWVRLESDAVRGPDGALRLPSANARASRIRLALEGARTFELGPAHTLEPSGEVAIRHDGGDAETGAGLEAGVGVRYVDTGRRLTVEGRVRHLLAHEAGRYEAREASASLRFDPRPSGRGFTVALEPGWGTALSGADRLWPGKGGGSEAGGAPGERLDAELGHGFRGPGPHGLIVPYTGIRFSRGAGRTWRAGTRWRIARTVTLHLEGERRELGHDLPARQSIALRAAVHW